MRRFWIGLALVLVLLGTTMTYAEGINMIGKKVDATCPVFINGHQLANDAIVIDGTSYIPVRPTADTFGFIASFVNKTVVLSPKLATNPPLSVKVHFTAIATRVSPDSLFDAKYLDGEWYLEAGAFGVYANWDGSQETVNIPGCNALVVAAYQNYQPGVDGFWDGVTYIKASALGLQATLHGSTLSIASSTGS
jgi:hypothetical protein